MNDVHSQVIDAREIALASAVVLDPSCIPPEFNPNDMRDELMGLVVATVMRMHRDGQTVDLYRVVEALDRGGALAEKCGPDAVHRLLALATVPLTADPAAIAREIHNEAQRGRLATKLELLRGAIADPTFSTESIQRQLTAAAEGLVVASNNSRVLDVADLVQTYPQLRQPVIHGIARRGETINLIAKSKVGKSWFAYLLGLCVAMGLKWLGRFMTYRGRVVIFDNELHPETLSHRINTVMQALGLSPEQCRGWFDVVPLRGQTRDIHALAPILRSIPRDKYSLIIVDALYRLLPDGTSENDNAQMTAVFNAIDRYGDQTGAAFALIHHASKGDQSGKDKTDVGSGAGAISRAADTHLILRPHEENDAVVLDAAIRSWEPITPIGLRWSFPLWYADDNLDTSMLKGRRPPGEERKSKADGDDCDKILEALKDEPASISKLSRSIGIGKQKLERLTGLMVRGKRLLEMESTVKGNPCILYTINPDAPKPKPLGDMSQIISKDVDYDSFA